MCLLLVLLSFLIILLLRYLIVKCTLYHENLQEFTRIGVSIWNSIPLSLKSLSKSAYQNKIKKLLLDVLNCEDDYIEVSKLIKHFATLT